MVAHGEILDLGAHFMDNPNPLMSAYIAWLHDHLRVASIAVQFTELIDDLLADGSSKHDRSRPLIPSIKSSGGCLDHHIGLVHNMRD